MLAGRKTTSHYLLSLMHTCININPGTSRIRALPSAEHCPKLCTEKFRRGKTTVLSTIAYSSTIVAGLLHVCRPRWLGSRVVSVLDSGAEGPGFKSQPRRCRSGNSLRQIVHTHCASVHEASKVVAALLRVAGVTAGLAENGSLPPTYLPHITSVR